ncbi:hypothetical protein [Nocardioides caldifontis]|uniref:hypothetical protein n=1 Tax=Nocardioides caldifontis TaxID=2588938 RepID=UPI0011E02CC2|nr:hypothetical protein [Nocardioides caldifontis]
MLVAYVLHFRRRSGASPESDGVGEPAGEVAPQQEEAGVASGEGVARQAQPDQEQPDEVTDSSGADSLDLDAADGRSVEDLRAFVSEGRTDSAEPKGAADCTADPHGVSMAKAAAPDLGMDSTASMGDNSMLLFDRRLTRTVEFRSFARLQWAHHDAWLDSVHLSTSAVGCITRDAAPFEGPGVGVAVSVTLTLDYRPVTFGTVVETVRSEGGRTFVQLRFESGRSEAKDFLLQTIVRQGTPYKPPRQYAPGRSAN